MSEKRPLALVTNDDGIESPFLRPLVEALLPFFRVILAAPKREQSWIGRALSRHRDLTVESVTLAGASGWMIDGTPTDCVNLALGHLVDETPAIVVSGLNIGYNVSMPMVLSSGTLAGAIEGAHWGIPALAASQALPQEAFRAVQNDRSTIPTEWEPVIRASTAHTAQIAHQVYQLQTDELEVHNLNYPYAMKPGTPVRMTVPAEIRSRCLFQPKSPGLYGFAYTPGEPASGQQCTDREALLEGWVSWTRLNFSRLVTSIELPTSIPTSN